MQKFYHITKTKNAFSIAARGLLPGFSRGIGGIKGSDKVFLTNDVDKIIKIQCGKEWMKDSSIVTVLADPQPHVYLSNEISDFEFVIDEVKPEQIIEINLYEPNRKTNPISSSETLSR